MEGILKVEPAKLRAASSEFEANRNAIMNLIDTMNTRIKGMNASWEGDAANAYQIAYGNLADDVERLNAKIAEHVRDLEEMAQVYETAEKAIETINQGLPGDAIE